ncbi:MAG: MAPEG family protein [Proteobacteria bacterium]|nr:MAPEG family protein [Pseudomonadota bacterium]
MPVPIWMLLGFASWTVLLLVFTIGVYRWSAILTARAQIAAFRSDQVEGADWYRRSMRAHANCIENLPVFAAIVLALQTSGTGGLAVEVLCSAVLVARVLQSLVHVCHAQTNAFVAVRFALFTVQLVSFGGLTGLVVHHLGGQG